MKKIIIGILLIIFIFLTYIFYKPIITDKILYESIEIGDFIVSIYDEKYDEGKIIKETKKLKNSEKVCIYAIEIVNNLEKDISYDVEYLKALSYSNDGQLNEFGEKINTPIEKINGKNTIKISEIIKNNNMTVDGITYLFKEEEIPNYNGILKSIKYSYLFEGYEVQKDSLKLKYISKESSKKHLILNFKYNKFGKLLDISVGGVI